MYLKVIVMELTEEYALAMDETGGVIRIIKKPGMKVGDCIYVLEEDRYVHGRDDGNRFAEHEKIVAFPKKSDGKAARHTKILRYAAAVAAALLIFVTAFIAYGNSRQAYAMVSLDGSHSVQLTLDDKNIVKTAVSIDDSIPQAQLENFIGKSLDELSQYFEDDDSENEKMIVGYAILKKASKEQEMAFQAYLKKLFGLNQVVYISGTSDDIREAKNKQQSLGIYLSERLEAEDERLEQDEDKDDDADESDEDDGEEESGEQEYEDKENYEEDSEASEYEQEDIDESEDFELTEAEEAEQEEVDEQEEIDDDE